MKVPDDLGVQAMGGCQPRAAALVLLGMYDLLWRRVAGGWFLLLAVLSYSPVYHVVVSDRFCRYPLPWLSLLAAGYLIHRRIAAPLASYCRSLRWVADCCDVLPR